MREETDMKKLICLVLLLSLLPCLLFSGCADSAERAWQSGQKALAEEKYDAAITAFQKAGSRMPNGSCSMPRLPRIW